MAKAKAGAAAIIERFVRSINDHDPLAAAACVALDYEDVTPARPGQEFRGRNKVGENLTALIRDVPDLVAEILRSVVDGDTVWIEWRMRGTRHDGTPLEMAGVNLFGVRDDQIAWGRIYTELVRRGGDIDAQIDLMTKGAKSSERIDE